MLYCDTVPRQQLFLVLVQSHGIQRDLMKTVRNRRRGGQHDSYSLTKEVSRPSADSPDTYVDQRVHCWKEAEVTAGRNNNTFIPDKLQKQCRGSKKSEHK